MDEMYELERLPVSVEFFVLHLVYQYNCCEFEMPCILGLAILS